MLVTIDRLGAKRSAGRRGRVAVPAYT